MRYPQATWAPGPAQKQGYPGLTVNACRGAVLHSMVGGYPAALNELLKADRRASWCFSVLKSGEVKQHYEHNAVTWHAGTAAANGKYVGIEHEGGLDPVSEPLTPKQRNASVALVRWLSQQCGFPLTRQVGLWEHRELSQTQCPSGRIPWAVYVPGPPPPAAEEEDVKPYLAWSPDRAALYLVGPLGARRILSPAVGDQLAKDLGPVKVAYSGVTLDAMNVPPGA